MTKYDLAKLFGSVDEKYIEGAKPEAQRAVAVRINRRSPVKLIAAASCTAAVLVGGVFAVNALHTRGNSAPLDNPGTVSIRGDDPSSAAVSNSGVVVDEKTENSYNDEYICYEGEYYRVTEDSLPQFKNPFHEMSSLVGIRRPSENTVEVVTMLKNASDKPLEMRCYGYDSVVEMSISPWNSDEDESVSRESMNDKPIGYVMQPGEEYYKKATFDADSGTYAIYTQYAWGGAARQVSAVTFTKDGFEDGLGRISEEQKTLTPEEWGALPHVLPSKAASEDFDFVNTTNRYGGKVTPLYAAQGSEVYAVDDGEVVYATYDNKWHKGAGCYVILKHGEGLYTLYIHLLPGDEGGEYVHTGDKVKAGQCIGLAGNTGNLTERLGVSYGFKTELEAGWVNGWSKPDFYCDAPDDGNSEIQYGEPEPVYDDNGNIIANIYSPIN